VTKNSDAKWFHEWIVKCNFDQIWLVVMWPWPPFSMVPAGAVNWVRLGSQTQPYLPVSCFPFLPAFSPLTLPSPLSLAVSLLSPLILHSLPHFQVSAFTSHQPLTRSVNTIHPSPTHSLFPLSRLSTRYLPHHLRFYSSTSQVPR